MKKFIYYLILFFFTLLISGFNSNNSEISDNQNLLIYYSNKIPQQIFAVKKLEKIISIIPTDNPDKADILIITSEKLSKAENVLSRYKSTKSEGYVIKKLPGKKVSVIASDQTGAMYGILDLAEQLQMGKTISSVEEKKINPTLIQGNLPMLSTRKIKTTKPIIETVHTTFVGERESIPS